MLVVRTSEGRADPICQLVGAQQTVGFDHPTLAVYPLGLYGVEPWALFGQQAADDPHPGFATALFDLPVMSGHPLSNLFGDVPGGVVPDQHPNLLARRLELLAAPPKEPRGYRAHGTTVHETHPHLLKLWHIKPVAGDGLRIGVVLGDRLFDEAHRRFARIAPAVEGRPRQAAEPGLLQESYRPLGMSRRQANQSVASEASFFLAYSGSGLVIHRLARSQRTPRRSRVARMVSPLTRCVVKPSSKLTKAARSNVHRLVSLPNPRGS